MVFVYFSERRGRRYAVRDYVIVVWAAARVQWLRDDGNFHGLLMFARLASELPPIASICLRLLNALLAYFSNDSYSRCSPFPASCNHRGDEAIYFNMSGTSLNCLPPIYPRVISQTISGMWSIKVQWIAPLANENGTIRLQPLTTQLLASYLYSSLLAMVYARALPTFRPSCLSSRSLAIAPPLP